MLSFENIILIRRHRVFSTPETKPTFVELSLCIAPASYLHLYLPVVLPWEPTPRQPIGRRAEVAAGEGVHVRGCDDGGETCTEQGGAG